MDFINFYNNIQTEIEKVFQQCIWNNSAYEINFFEIKKCFVYQKLF